MSSLRRSLLTAVFPIALSGLLFSACGGIAEAGVDTKVDVGVESARANPMPAIVPAVCQRTGGVGSVDIRSVPVFIAAVDAAALRPTAEVLAEDMVTLGLPRPEIIVGDPPAG